MKLELNIKDDKELRDTIKDMVRGQVMSIVREELKALAREALLDKIKSMNSNDLRSVLGMNKYHLSDSEYRILAEKLITKELVANAAEQHKVLFRQYVKDELSKQLNIMASEAIKNATAKAVAKIVFEQAQQ